MISTIEQIIVSGKTKLFKLCLARGLNSNFKDAVAQFEFIISRIKDNIPNSVYLISRLNSVMTLKILYLTNRLKMCLLTYSLCFMVIT